LKITDRKKEIFKTSGGKYVAPQMIESLMKTSQFIEQAMVVGAGEKMPCAFILPEFEYIKKWITHKGLNIDITSKKAIVGSKEVIERIQRAIDEINLELGNWEQIKKFVLVPDDWTIESGLVTPTLKLRRKLILEKYRPQYEKMYGRA
jgi:long-chain acyl-CoA synthetase